MRLLLVSLVSFAVSFSAFGNNGCTKQLNGYVAGLEAGATLTAITPEQRSNALQQLEHIKKLRANLNDCDVVQHIPKLKQNRDALKYASEKARKG